MEPVVETPEARPSEPPAEPTTPWYDGWGFDDDQLKTVGRYKTRESFGKAFFEQRKKISEGIQAPNPDASPEEHLAQLRAARLRLGAKDSPDKYTVTVPDDLKEYVTANMPDVVQALQKDAARYGMTQWELDQAAEEGFKQIRQAKTNREAKDKEAQDAQRERKEKNDELLDRTFGKRKEAALNDAILEAQHYDDTLFFADNEALPEEVRAEKGGLLVQHLRAADDPVLWRLFASMRKTRIGEPQGAPAGATPAQKSLYQDRYEKVQKMYPKRPEIWEELAQNVSVAL